MDVILDLRKIKSKRKLHKVIKKTFEFKVYGANLDALFDNLSTYYNDLFIKVIKPSNIKDLNFKEYLDKFYETLKDISLENKYIKYELIDENDLSYL